MDGNIRDRGTNSPGMQRLRRRPDYTCTPEGAGEMDNFRHPVQPVFDSEEMKGSIQMILSENIGTFVVIEFLVGSNEMIRKQGLLYFVGRSFVTLYDEAANNFLVCDIFSVRFVYFYMPGDRPRYNYNTLPPVSGEPGMGMMPPGRRR